MVVRERVGRFRYIAFIVSPPVAKERLLSAIHRAPVDERPRLVEYDGGRGLVRCAHTAKDAMIAFLNEIRIGASAVRTTGTSGTIRKARAKFLTPRRSRDSPK